MSVIRTLGPTSLVRKCNRHGCPLMVHGFLVMLIPAAGKDAAKSPPLRLPVPLFLCNKHKGEASAQDFQTPEWRKQMRDVLNVRGATVVPDFENAWLDIQPFELGNEIGEGEAAHGSA